MKIKANGISMHYEIKGKGENIVLIHGAGDTLDMWYHQVPVFSRNYSVTTYDIRGFGKTESPETAYTMSLLAEDAHQLMKTIGVAGGYFLGYSMGGRIALDLALDHPEMVKAIILANSYAGLASPSSKSAELRRLTSELLEKGDMKKVAEVMTINAFSHDFKSKNPIEFIKYMKIKLQNKPGNFARVMRALEAPSTPPDLSKIKCPVLIIAGENDVYMTVEQCKQMNNAISGSQLVILPTGHAAAVELPDEFNQAVLKFLSEL